MHCLFRSEVTCSGKMTEQFIQKNWFDTVVLCIGAGYC